MITGSRRPTSAMIAEMQDMYARHVVMIEPDKRDHAIRDIVDDTTKQCQTKGGLKLNAQKFIDNGARRKLFKKFKSFYLEVTMSASLSGPAEVIFRWCGDKRA